MEKIKPSLRIYTVVKAKNTLSSHPVMIIRVDIVVLFKSRFHIQLTLDFRMASPNDGTCKRCIIY